MTEGGGQPPGTNYKPAKDRPGYQNESQRRQVKHARSMHDLQKSVPADMIRGKPIDYDSYGLPSIPEPGPEDKMRKAMEEGEYLESTPVAQPRQAPINQAAMAERGIATPQPQAPIETTPLRSPAPKTGQELFGGNQEAPRQEAPRQAPARAAEPIPPYKKPQHPVIQKLLRRFGLKKAERYDLEVFTEDSNDKTKYTMTLLPDELNTWALEEAKKKAVTMGETAVGVYFEHLIVCSSVVAIDSVPIWQVFELKAEPWEAEDLVEDVLNIPLRMRRTCGIQLAELLWSETRPLTEKLSDFYQNKILDRRKITSSFDEENEGTYRYVCVKDTCATVEILKPKVWADGSEQDFYCKYCGGPIVKAADIQQDESVPLG